MMSTGLKVLSCCAPATAATTLRATRAGDFEHVQALLVAAELPVEGVREHLEDGYVIAEQAGQLAGVAGMELYGGAALLRSVAVAGAFRGRGLGAELVQERLQWARERGVAEVYLLTTTAAPFFARFGFTEVARSAAPAAMQSAPEFEYLCADSATAMRLSLVGGDDVRAFVRERYADAARAAARGEKGSCCGDNKARPWNPITANLYAEAETGGLPVEALLASLGCGNPTALAELAAGETVLDLGSGGGIDVLLSARRVGPNGKAYGLDMTDEMLALARANQAKAGVANVEFLKGEIEQIPLPDSTVDVIISNCVINLSADKARVLREAYRVLKPGGRLAISDIVVRGAMPGEIRRNVELWTGCVAGALEEEEYLSLLVAAGFERASVEPTRIYGAADISALTSDAGLALAAPALGALDGKFMSAFVRARKPA